MGLMSHPTPKQCIFEHIYFSLPNSVVFGRSMYRSRLKLGETLAALSPVEADVVIDAPDSGVVAAIGYVSKSGLPFQRGLIRSHYVGRTFIEPSQKIRDFGVKLKLAPVKDVMEGKGVVVVDDSIVRGTTLSKIVRMIREFIGSDSLAFIPLDQLQKLMGSESLNYCYACFSGQYHVFPDESSL